MKTLGILILVGIAAFDMYAQQPSYTANLDFYVGTWKYENEQTGEVFVLKLRKTVNRSRECVVGAYTYKKNEQIVLDCMDQFSSTQKSPISMPVYATNSSITQNLVNPNKLRMFIIDFGKFCPNGDTKRTSSNELLLVSNAFPNKIRWILKNDRETSTVIEEIPPIEFSIPTDIILTKQ